MSQSSVTFAALAFVSLAAASGCKQLKPEQDSKSKDVEAVMDGRNDAEATAGETTPTVRTCGGGSPTATPKEALQKSHARLPSRLKQEFPLDGVNGTAVVVMVKDQVAVPKSDSAKDWRACFAPSSKDAAGSLPVVFVLEDTAAIYDNLVATTVWAYSGHWIDQVIPMALEKMEDGATKTQLTQLEKIFSDARSEMASAYVAMLKDDDVVKGYTDRFKAKDKDDLATKTLFQNFVLAETAEEFYCSDDPKRPLMADAMKPVLNAFMAIALHFGTEK